MYEAFCLACAGLGLILGIGFLGGTILAIIEIIHDKHGCDDAAEQEYGNDRN